MRIDIKALFIVSLVSLVSISGFAGHETGNGGDNLPIEYGSAWFVGSTPFTYCIEHDVEFGISKKTAEDEISKVIEKWRTYTSERRVHASEHETHGLNFNYIYNIVCDGSEALTIYLGVSNQRVENIKKSFANPTAFAHRELFDLQTGIGKGFIWFANSYAVYPGANFPDWSKVDTFHGMALHEFGHVLGCGHVDRTIMTSNLTSWMQMTGSLEGRRKYVMTHIDDLNILYRSQFKPLKDVEGTISYGSYNQSHENQVFEEFFGRAAVGNITVYFSERPYLLRFEDSLGHFDIPLKIYSDSESRVTRASGVFFSVRANSDPASTTKQTGYSYASESSSFLIEFKAPNSTNYRGMLAINGDSIHGKVHITYFGENGIQNLFSTTVQSVK